MSNHRHEETRKQTQTTGTQ